MSVCVWPSLQPCIHTFTRFPANVTRHFSAKQPRARTVHAAHAGQHRHAPGCSWLDVPLCCSCSCALACVCPWCRAQRSSAIAARSPAWIASCACAARSGVGWVRPLSGCVRWLTWLVLLLDGLVYPFAFLALSPSVLQFQAGESGRSCHLPQGRSCRTSPAVGSCTLKERPLTRRRHL